MFFICIDVTEPACHHPDNEPVADASNVVELSGNVDKPKVCTTKIVFNIYELFFYVFTNFLCFFNIIC